MRQLTLLIVLSTAACLAAGQLRAQQLTTAQIGIAHPATALPAPHTVSMQAMVHKAPRRWPYVVGGSVVGGAAGAVWLAHQVAKTDDAMVSPLHVVGAISAGAALGALGGLIVSVMVDPRYE